MPACNVTHTILVVTKFSIHHVKNEKIYEQVWDTATIIPSIFSDQASSCVVTNLHSKSWIFISKSKTNRPKSEKLNILKKGLARLTNMTQPHLTQFWFQSDSLSLYTKLTSIHLIISCSFMAFIHIHIYIKMLSMSHSMRLVASGYV